MSIRNACPTALGTLAAVLGLLAVTCAGANGGHVPSDPVDHFALRSLDPEVLQRFGCGAPPRKKSDPYMVCVNACTGRLVQPNVTPEIAEGQQVAIRLVGWEACQPTKASCSLHNVNNLDIGIMQPPTPPPAGTGTSTEPKSSATEHSQAAQQTLAQISLPAPTIAPSKVASEELTASLRDVTGKSANKLDPEVQGVADAQSSFVAPDATPQLRVESGLSLVKKANDLVSTAQEKLTKKKGAVAAAQKVQEKANASVIDFVQRVSAAMDTAVRQLNQVDPRELQQPQLKEQAIEAVGAYAAKIRKVSSDNRPTVEELQSAYADAKDSVAKVASDAKAKAAQDEQEAIDAGVGEEHRRETTPRVFGDCKVTIPNLPYIRQVVVDVKITHPNPCDNSPSAAHGRLPACPPAGSGQTHNSDAGTKVNGAATTDPDDPNEINIDPQTTTTLVYLTISHGKYYYDVGFITAVVPLGQRTVSAPQRAGVPGDTSITVTSQTAVATGIALNLYPGGHRRDAYSGFEPNFWRPHWGDMLGLQLAISPDLRAPQSTLFGGVLFEPVTGVALGTGAILLKGDFLQSGYYEGMSTSAPRGDYVVQKYMLRWHAGVTFGVELFNTTAKRLQPTSPSSGQ